MSTFADHETWMRFALLEAQKSFAKDEVPVGAVAVHEGRIIGRGHNLVETLQDPTAHAEILALTAAANSLASWRLEEVVLYVTLEPCMMCTGALLLARIAGIVYGAADERYGACGSKMNLANGGQLDVQAPVIGGVLQQESSEMLKAFFRKLRQRER